jgi:hypothetical protein
MTVYDKSDYHLERFPRRKKRNAAFVHIALFFTWIVDRGLHAECVEEDEDLREPLRKLRARAIFPTDFLINCDEILYDEMMNDEGNRFASFFYDHYVWYVPRLFNVKSLYDIEETWANYEKVKAFLDHKYDEWVSLGRPESPHHKDGPLMRFLRRFI